MLADVPTIDGWDWTAKRIAFLESLLDDDPTPEQRAAIEAELEDLKSSHTRWRWLARFVPGRP
jgi:hypothetical protein